MDDNVTNHLSDNELQLYIADPEQFSEERLMAIEEHLADCDGPCVWKARLLSPAIPRRHGGAYRAAVAAYGQVIVDALSILAVTADEEVLTRAIGFVHVLLAVQQGIKEAKEAQRAMSEAIIRSIIVQLVARLHYGHLGPEENEPVLDSGPAKALRDEIDSNEAAGRTPDPALLVASGLAYQATGEAFYLSEARTSFETAAKCSPNSYEVQILLGQVLHEQQWQERSEKALDRAAELLAKAQLSEPET